MRGPFSAQEFAGLTGLSPADIERYREHALLDLDGDGVFDDYDLLRAWYLVKRHPELEPEELARGLREGRLRDRLTDGPPGDQSATRPDPSASLVRPNRYSRRLFVTTETLENAGASTPGCCL